MPDERYNNDVYRFGEFSIDVSERMLRRNGEIVALPPRVFDTLLILVEKHGSVLTKREMLDRIWPDVFVEDGNLTQNIYLLRRTLEKAPDGKEWIKTVPRKGYVFRGEILPSDRGAKDVSVSSRFPSTRSTPFSPVKLLGAFVALAAVMGLGFMLRIGSWSGSVAAARDISFKKVTFSGDIDFPVISPDSNTFAFSRGGRLMMQSIGLDDAREISLPLKMEAGFLQFTPDGRSVAFRNQRQFYLAGDVYSIGTDGGELRLVAQNVWSGFAFSPDGRQISFIRDIPERNVHQLVIRNIDSASETTLAEMSSPSRFILIGSPAWSNDGNRIATAQLIREAGSPRVELGIYTINDGSREHFAPPQIKQFEQAVWLPGDKRIAVIARENERFFQVWELGYPTGRLTRLTNDLNIYRSISISADGKKLLAANNTIYSHVWIADGADLPSQKQMTYGNLNRDGTIGLEWLPDGRIVYASRIVGNVDIWRVGPTDIDRMQLTREAGDVNSYPDLAPDGKTLYFSSTRTGNTQIWKMDAKTGRDQTQLTFGENEVNELPQVSPDGKWLYFVKKAKNETGIWRRPLSGGADEPVSVDRRLSPTSFLAISPDGRFMATCNLTSTAGENQEAPQFQVAIVSTEERNRLISVDLPSVYFAWTPAGGTFDYVENAPGGARIWRRDLVGSAPKLLWEEKGAFVAGIKWKADGKELAISKGRRLRDAILLTNF